MQYRYKLGWIGCGNMAKAIADGLLNHDILPREQMILSAAHAKGDYRGIRVVTDNQTILTECEYVILAVKPQIFHQICDRFTATQARCVVSIMAGVGVDTLRRTFPNAHILRVMPNTPCAVAKGMSVISENTDVPQEINAFVHTIFAQIGEVATLAESQFHEMTAVSGSGPAYVYYFIRSMTDAAVRMGLSETLARKLTLQTLDGAVEMVRRNPEVPIDELIERVCSKGGTTIQAIDTFRADELEAIIDKAMTRCRNRSEELSKL